MVTDELLLLSGGLDSTALAALRRPTDALTIDYGHVCGEAELAAAQTVCDLLGIRHHRLTIDCSGIGAGLLAGQRLPDDHGREDSGVAAEFWPFRNQLLATLAAGVAFRLGVSRVVLGCVSTDRKRHVDGGPAFVAALAAVTRMQEGGIDIIAPAADLSTQDLIERADLPLSVLGWTHSCHTANLACGWCPGCRKRDLVLGDIAPLR